MPRKVKAPQVVISGPSYPPQGAPGTMMPPGGYPVNYTQPQPAPYPPTGAPPAYNSVVYPPQQTAYTSGPASYPPQATVDAPVYGQVQTITLSGEQRAQVVTTRRSLDVTVLAFLSIFINPCLGIPACLFAHLSTKNDMDPQEARRYRLLSVFLSASAIMSFAFLIFFLFLMVW